MGLTKKILKIIIAFLIISTPMCLTVFAENSGETMEYYEEYRSMLDALPDNVEQVLPSELYSGNVTDIVNGAAKMSDFGYILNAALEFLGLELDGALKLFGTLMGVVILAATMNTVKTSFSSSGVNDAFSICTSCAVFLVAAASQYSIVKSVAEFFTRICTLA